VATFQVKVRPRPTTLHRTMAKIKEFMIKEPIQDQSLFKATTNYMPAFAIFPLLQ